MFEEGVGRDGVVGVKMDAAEDMGVVVILVGALNQGEHTIAVEVGEVLWLVI